MAKKLVLIGDGYTGKTCLRAVLSREQPKHLYVPTLGVECEPLRINNTVINIWDTAGEERFRGLRSCYYIAADAAILVIDARKDPTGQEHWLEEMKAVAPDCKFLVIASHFDRSEEASRRLNAYTETVLWPLYGATVVPVDFFANDFYAEDLIPAIMELFL